MQAKQLTDETTVKLNRCGDLSDICDLLQVAIYQELDGYKNQASITISEGIEKLTQLLTAQQVNEKIETDDLGLFAAFACDKALFENNNEDYFIAGFIAVLDFMKLYETCLASSRVTFSKEIAEISKQIKENFEANKQEHLRTIEGGETK